MTVPKQFRQRSQDGLRTYPWPPHVEHHERSVMSKTRNKITKLKARVLRDEDPAKDKVKLMMTVEQAIYVAGRLDSGGQDVAFESAQQADPFTNLQPQDNVYFALIDALEAEFPQVTENPLYRATVYGS